MSNSKAYIENERFNNRTDSFDRKTKEAQRNADIYAEYRKSAGSGSALTRLRVVATDTVKRDMKTGCTATAPCRDPYLEVGDRDDNDDLSVDFMLVPTPPEVGLL